VLHKALAATWGAVGGSFGLAALPVELRDAALMAAA
jgi:hypothetical protein